MRSRDKLPLLTEGPALAMVSPAATNSVEQWIKHQR